MLRILLLAALLPAQSAIAGEVPLTKPAKPTTMATPASAAHYWYDSGRRRGLLLDEELTADFSGSATPLARKTAPAGKALGAATEGEVPGESPVFRDADSPAVKRALPGGVIVTTRAATDRDSIDRLLAARGLSVSRQLDADGTRWLVETAPGMAALELANALHESGDFAAVAPNWWRERALK